VAIIRPGPIVGQMLNPFLRRRQGREPAECLHPSLEPVLRRTLGVPLFQEQLLRMAMIVAGFSGGEAEELRRAMGFKRSEARMRDIETRLRDGMTRNGIIGKQDSIVQSITAFALYGFPESHAASFALIAYASAYLKCRYLAAFTAAILNNQPMGFYAPATLVKDAQRHGLHFNPIDVTRSDWLCTIEEENGERRVRLGLNYVKGLREQPAQAILTARAQAPFDSIQDLVDRVPELRKDELRKLSEIGALNFITASPTHRRAALWDSELAIRPTGSLFANPQPPIPNPSPLVPMTSSERLNSDFRNTHLTIGKHPMAFHREKMDALGVTPAAQLKFVRNGRVVRIAGCIICRQRPGTAKGLLFLSIEDETGVSNAVVMPDVFDRERKTILNNSYLVIDGEMQNIDNVYTVRAAHCEPLHVAEEAVPSHDFH